MTRWFAAAVVALAVTAGAFPTASAQPVCPLIVQLGEPWLGKRKVTVTNVGTGRALGVTLYWQGVTSAPGASGSTQATLPLANFAEIRPGESVEIQDNANVIGGGYVARAQACI